MTKTPQKKHRLFLSRRGVTLLEMMGLLVLLALSLLTMFTVLTQGVSFSHDTEARVRAINLAREGIEAVMNIRNTNWLRFTSDRTQCWDTFNYSPTCIGADRNDPNSSSGFLHSGSYVIHQVYGNWTLSGMAAWDGTDWDTSFSRYRLGVDTDGWYTHTGYAFPCSTLE